MKELPLTGWVGWMDEHREGLVVSTSERQAYLLLGLGKKEFLKKYRPGHSILGFEPMKVYTRGWGETYWTAGLCPVGGEKL